MGILELAGTWIIVILFLLLVWWCSKKYLTGFQGSLHSKYMKMIDRIPISQDKSVVLVQIGDKYYLLGIASSSINVLAELNEDDIIEFNVNPQSFINGINFNDIIKKMGGKGKNGH